MNPRLNHQLSYEEAYYKEEIKSLRWNRWVSLTQVIALIVSALAFYLVTNPQSVENLQREKARLQIEVIKEKDPRTQLIGMEILRETFPDLVNKLDHQIIDDALTTLDTELMTLRTKKQEIEKALENSQNENEESMFRANLRTTDILIKRLEAKKLESQRNSDK